MLAPVLFVDIAYSIHVDREGRIPVADVLRIGDAGVVRCITRIRSAARQVHNAAEAKARPPRFQLTELGGHKEAQCDILLPGNAQIVRGPGIQQNLPRRYAANG